MTASSQRHADYIRRCRRCGRKSMDVWDMDVAGERWHSLCPSCVADLRLAGAEVLHTTIRAGRR